MSLTIIDGFDNRSNNPLDAKYIVADVTALSSLQFQHKGMWRWVESEQNIYVLQNNLVTWKALPVGQAIKRWLAGSYKEFNLVLHVGSLYESQVNNNTSEPGVNGDWIKILGQKGDPGDPGTNGRSAYQYWLDNGNTGSVSDFLIALRGQDGDTIERWIEDKPYPLDRLVRYGAIWESQVADNLSEPGANADWIKIAGGDQIGWTPVLAIEGDGDRRVQKVIDWIGGLDPKPAIDQYVGSEGFVETATEAVDIRGEQGIQGEPGIDAPQIDDGAVSLSTVWSSSKIDSRFDGLDTTQVPEATNLYWTPARFDTAFAAKSTSDLTEGSNLYFTNARADARISAARNVANGVAGLDASGLVPSSLLPSYVDDVIEAANLGAFPGSGEAGKIYVAIDTGKTYRWGGSAYAEISASPGSSDAVPEGSVNLYFTNTRVQTVGDARYSQLGHTHTFASLTSKPTTLAGYGITDAQAPLSGTGLVKSAAGTISYVTDNSSNWNTAFGWGNHAGLYPTYNGTGAAGTWGIGITGNAGTITGQANSATILASELNIGNTIVKRDVSGDFNARTITLTGSLSAPTIQGSTLISTVPTGTAPFTVTSTTPVANLSIGGNAATATLASNWGGYLADFAAAQGGSLLHVIAQSTDGTVRKHNAASVQAFLGLGSLAYLNNGTTLSSSITGNAATATNVAYSGLTGAVPTWNQNTTGNANSATNWGFKTANLLVEANSPIAFLGLESDGSTAKYVGRDKARLFLELGSNAYNSTAYLQLTGGTLSGDVWAELPTGNNSWTSKIGSKNSAVNKSVFLGVYEGRSLLVSHNYALNAWMPLYINTADGITGHDVYLSSGNTLHAGALTGTSATFSSLSSSGDVLASANNSGLIGKVTIGSGLSLSSGVLTATGGSAGTVTGSGTAGKIVKWNSASDIGEASSLTISGSDFQVAGVVQGTSFTGSGTGLTGTASGLTAGSATNAINWGGYLADFITPQGGSLLHVIGQSTDGTVRKHNAASVQSFLGLGSMAYVSTASYYSASTSDGRYAYVGGGNASGTWGINITGNAATATNIAWTGVTGKPTSLSGFTNDLGNYGGWITGYTETDTLASVTSRGNSTTAGITVNGTLTATGDVVAYGTSDRDFKDNLTRIPNALSSINLMSGYSFNWNAKQDTYEHGLADLGVVAQEVEALFPQMVVNRENGKGKAVRYDRLIPVMIEAIKELTHKVERLENGIS